MNKRRPTHPGAVLREDIISEIGLSEAALAARLKLPPSIVHEVISEQRPVDADIALRLARVFKTSPDFWLRMQQAVDIWEAQAERQREYGQLKALEARTSTKPTAKIGTRQEKPETLDDPCELCGNPMVLKQGRVGKFLSCSDYPSCRNIRRAA